MTVSTDTTTMHITLQDALDELASTRSSPSNRTRALNTLEELLATACTSQDSNLLEVFLMLQDTFECNIPSRLISCLAVWTPKLESLLHKSASDSSKDVDVALLAQQIHQALSIVQGVALTHTSSKRYLGRKHPLQVLLDLLLTSRHLSSPRSNASNPATATPVSSAVLDTLLCILVDSSPALRSFEDANGCQVVVKILKRSGTPREVRMKCLEFLYFYLMDESAPDQAATAAAAAAAAATVQTSLSSSTSSILSFSSYASSSRPASPPVSSRAPSTQRAILSHSRARSLASVSGKPRSGSSSSESGSTTPSGSTSSVSSVSSVTSVESGSTPTHSRSKSALTTKREADYGLVTPRKPGINGLGPRLPGSSSHGIPPRTPLPTNALPETPSSPTPTEFTFASPPTSPAGSQHSTLASRSRGNSLVGSLQRFTTPATRSDATRTTEEKKALLGNFLSNVDSLVEGVRKAGVWGLA